MTRFLPVLLLMILAFAMAPPAAAQDDARQAVGTVIAVEGLAGTGSGEDAAALEAGQNVYLNDTIETGPDSKLLILLNDDAELTLGENARLIVDEYVLDAAVPDNSKGRLSVLRGAFLFASGLMGQTPSPDIEIETAYGSIGIRGTTVWGGTIDDVYSVFVPEGSASFATDRGKIIIREGEGSSARSRRAIPGRSTVWSAEKIARAVATVTLQDNDTARQRIDALLQARDGTPATEPEPEAAPAEDDATNGQDTENTDDPGSETTPDPFSGERPDDTDSQPEPPRGPGAL